MLLLEATETLPFWHYIQPFDAWLLTKINQDWGNFIFDSVLPYFRETLFWIPLYLFLFVLITLNFRMKGWWLAIAVAITAAVSDLVSSQFIKPLLFRTRPCRDEEIMNQIRFFINYCPTSSSFPSSHATTHFAQAIFIYLTLRHTGKGWGLLILWAFLIGYSQIYVGVHYPVDVLGGAVLGSCIGWSMSQLFRKQLGMLSLDK